MRLETDSRDLGGGGTSILANTGCTVFVISFFTVKFLNWVKIFAINFQTISNFSDDFLKFYNIL